MLYPHIQSYEVFCKHKAHKMLNANLDLNKPKLSALKPQTRVYSDCMAMTLLLQEQNQHQTHGQW